MAGQRISSKTCRFPEDSELHTLANGFLLDCEARNLTVPTVRFYWQRLGLFLNFLDSQNVHTAQSITAHQIRTFLASYRDRGLSPYYAHQAARTIKTWCSWLVREEVLDVSPMRTVKMPKLPKDVLPPFTAKDVASLLAACDTERDRAMVLFLLDSGVRASELLALDIGDVHMSTGAVLVRLGKGQKTRTTFIGSRTKRALTEYLSTRGRVDSSQPLFLSAHGKRISFFGLQSLLRRLALRSGVHPAGAHRFRRTFAIESLRAGMPLPQLAALMGHSQLSILGRYLRLVTDDLQAAHREHGPVDSLLSKGGRR